MTHTHVYRGAWGAVVDLLRAASVDVLFGLPGDDLAAVRAVEPTGLRFVLCRDQRNAAFMATGYAIQSGRPGVCVIGRGPASTTVLTGLLEARFSAAPLLVIGGGTSAEHRGSAAFQELDQIPLVRPLVKWAERVDHPSRVVPALERALTIATTGVPGAVYVEIPDDLHDREVVRRRPWATAVERATAYDADRLDGAAVRAIRRSRRPVVVAGGGLRHRNADGAAERFAERIGAALFSTASGRSALDEEHSQFCGLSGLYARPETERIRHTADLVIALGSRLEETATFGWDLDERGVEVVQVNVDAAEFSAEFAGPRVLGDVGGVLEAWTRLVPRTEPAPDWPDLVARARADLLGGASAPAPAGGGDVRVPDLLRAVCSAVPDDRVLVQENGLQDMWSYLYPYYSVGRRGGSVVPSEQTSLGFGAVGAAGVKLAAPDRPVVAFVGDGAFAQLGADLDTMAAERIGVLFVVLCNGGHGWLQDQLRRAGLGTSRFSFVGTRRVPSAGVGDRHEVVVDATTDLTAELARALRECDRGRVAVLYAPVDLADVPPGIADAAGVPQ